MSKKACLLFGEGKTDRVFVDKLRRSDGFLHHTNNQWTFKSDNISGGLPSHVLNKCIASKLPGQYALCFCDTDLLKDKKEQMEIEKKALKNNTIMMWQFKNLEEEMVRVIYKDSKSKQSIWIRRLQKTSENRGKYKMKVQKKAHENIALFANSSYLDKIYSALKSFESRVEMPL